MQCCQTTHPFDGWSAPIHYAKNNLMLCIKIETPTYSTYCCSYDSLDLNSDLFRTVKFLAALAGYKN